MSATSQASSGSDTPLRWGIVGTGAIARRFTAELSESHTSRVVAVGSRNQRSARDFAAEFGLASAHLSYDSLIEDSDVDAVYLAVPHHDHARWAIRAAEAGRHVLCEKPITLHRGDAEAVIDAASASGVFLMEAFMYRCHPQTDLLLRLIGTGILGELRVVEAVHSFRGADRVDGRLLNPDLGGGGILDVGCYCMSGARLVVGAAIGDSAAAEPLEIEGMAHIGSRSGVDEWAVATLRFREGILAHLATGVQVDQPPALRLHGSDASIEVETPWLPGIDGRREHRVTVRQGGRVVGVEVARSDRGLYAIEADEVARCIRLGLSESPAVPWADTVGNMAALDLWRRKVGLSYPAERTESLTTPLRGSLRRPRTDLVPRDTITGIAQPVSRLALGTMLAYGAETWPTAMAMFDAFFELGGNLFDSARRYGQGESDRALGHWMRTRGVREQSVVIAKGAHTPNCDPETLSKELLESLEDLETDYADLYFLHRDNVEVPVGEFVDVLNEHRRAGRIRSFGGSNWTLERVDEANRYAERTGQTGFSAVSNQFSLARMVVPTFPGCLSASDAAWSEWIARTDLALVAWSSLAAGFFARSVDPELQRAWSDPDNEERRARTERLADQLRVAPNAIALAWVLAHPRVFPIIGPRRLAELRQSVEALELTLGPDELAWLDLEADSPGSAKT